MSELRLIFTYTALWSWFFSSVFFASILFLVGLFSVFYFVTACASWWVLWRLI